MHPRLIEKDLSEIEINILSIPGVARELTAIVKLEHIEECI